MNNDAPLINIDDDNLNFKPYVEKVAQSIINYNDKKSFVFSVEGEWGIGKTTFINFLLKELKAKDNKIRTIQFNPWLITDTEQIFKLFFDELYSVIVSHSADAYLKSGMKNFKKMMQYFAPDDITVGIDSTKVKYNINKRLENKIPSLYELKESINKYLEELKLKIVIVIDDIDRLSDNETEHIFRLIKGVADFYNLIYILPYDKTIVSKSLDQFKSGEGTKYLEKIVQYQLTIPKPHRVKIKEILEEKINQLYPNHYTKLYPTFNILDKYIRTIRDINQIINILDFEYRMIKDDVDFLDFFILSIFRIKVHSLYEKIKHSPESFAPLRKEGKEVVNDFKDWEDDKKLLKLIYHERYNNREKSIKNENYFENYFSYSVSSDLLSHSEYIEIEEILFKDNYHDFEIIYKKYQEKFNYFIDRLTYKNKNNTYIALTNCLKNSNINNNYTNLFDAIYLKKSAYDNTYEYTILNKDMLKLLGTDYDNSTIPLYNILIVYYRCKYRNDNQEIECILKEKLEEISFDDFIKEKYSVKILEYFYRFEVDSEEIKEKFKEYATKDNKQFFKIVHLFMEESYFNSSFCHFICTEESIREYVKEINITELSENEQKIFDKIKKTYVKD